MKKAFTILLAAMLLLCACSAQEYTLTHKLIEVDYPFQGQEQYQQVMVFRDLKTFNTFANSITEPLETLPENHHSDDKNLVEPFQRYTRDYFRENILIIVTLTAGSGGDRFAVGDITKTDDGLTINITQTQDGQTCDMNGWCVLIELDRSFDTDPENIQLNLT